MNNPFFDVSLSTEERLDWLLGEMTMEEKLMCMATRAPSIERLGIQGFAVGGEAAHGVEARNDQNDLGAAEPTTSFVQPVGMSATWDRELIRQAGEVTGTEARVLYHRHPDRGLSRWAPTVDLERDPRWGRTEEGYGEDPLLAGRMASAYIRGVQGDHPDCLRAACTLKHFYANNTEEGRGYKSASIDPRNRMELYLEPFRRCIEEGGAEAVMAAYNKINGVPGMLNPEIQHLLKDRYGLSHAVCDGGAMEMVSEVHHYCGTHAEAFAQAVKVGVDAMSDDPAIVREAAREAWELGLITEAEIDRALRNLFRTKLRLGIYDGEPCNPYDRVTEEELCCARHREISRRVAREAAVLLKNENAALPLNKQEDAALIGPYADAWYHDWYGGEPPYRSTLKQGVEEVTGRSPQTADGDDRVIFQCGGKALALADDGALILADRPEVFVKQDWDEGKYTFYSERTGKYLSPVLPKERGADLNALPVRADRDEPFDWFVTEIFHIYEKADGRIALTTRFDMPLRVNEAGQVISGPRGAGSLEDAALSKDAAPSENAALSGDAALSKGAALSEDGELLLSMEIVESGLERAVRLAKTAKTVILALGCSPMVSAKEEVDRKSIQLPPAQEELMRQVCAANPNTVLALFSNYPYAINWAQEHIPAIVWNATGSQDMGTAMAQTLFGENAPAGRLNFTWYRSDDQLPDIDDYDIIKGGRTYRYFAGDVLYPFGYGLTYTAFSYTDLQVCLADPGRISVSVSVKNLGGTASDEVVQIYGQAPASRVKKPLVQLLAFERLRDIRPGEERRAEFMIPTEEFRFYDTISRMLMVEEGTYRIFAGRSSRDLLAEASVQVPGRKTGSRNLRERHPADHFDDYENMILTTGHFGFTAAAPKDSARAMELVYRDCALSGKENALFLHLLSDTGCRIEVLLDGRTVGCWEGETRTYESRPGFGMDERSRRERAWLKTQWEPVYTDVRVDLQDVGEARENAELLLRVSGDAKLCFFRVGILD